jgi:methyltransferase (TIGR00027 family)
MMTGREPLAGVGRTALGVAYVRAQESRRRDRLFDDPYAQAFVDAAPDSLPATRDEAERRLSGMMTLGAVFGWHAIIRTRFFDDYLTEACHAGCSQVVLLAAGLDTRAFRLGWPEGTRLFEIDLPDVMSFKHRVLADQSALPRCQRMVIAADLREAWPAHLVAGGFDPLSATAWLVEGLLIYLSADEATRLLTDITVLSAPGSHLAFEHGSIADSAVFGTPPGWPSPTDDRRRPVPAAASLPPSLTRRADPGLPHLNLAQDRVPPPDQPSQSVTVEGASAEPSHGLATL